jgi:hypothetical protein
MAIGMESTMRAARECRLLLLLPGPPEGRRLVAAWTRRTVAAPPS